MYLLKLQRERDLLSTPFFTPILRTPPPFLISRVVYNVFEKSKPILHSITSKSKFRSTNYSLNLDMLFCEF